MNQLSLLDLEPKRFDENRKPDSRHPWLILSAWGGRPTDWRCEACGELATVNLYGDAWVFLRPQLIAMHECDIPACCNPSHVFPGTTAANRADCVAKERGARGEGHGMARITEDLVRELRALKGTAPLTTLAARFGLYKSHAWLILNRRIWKHVA